MACSPLQAPVQRQSRVWDRHRAGRSHPEAHPQRRGQVGLCQGSEEEGRCVQCEGVKGNPKISKNPPTSSSNALSAPFCVCIIVQLWKTTLLK